jgi:hypothetical protein
MEGAAWLGITAPILALLTICMRKPSHERRWRAIAIIYFVWALGPYLTIGGVNTGLLFPQQFLRYVPVLANARIPGRALIVVSLAVAILAACWAASRRPRIVYALAAVIAAEQLATPFPLAAMEVPHVYYVLATRDPGTVLELPFGYRDGFGLRGAFDDARMLYQTVHRHPMAGGFVARLSPRIEAYYQQRPVLAGLLRLSAGEAPAESLDCETALRDLRVAGIRYVVMQDAMPPPLRDVVHGWPLSRIAGDDRRTLYELGDRCG